MARTTLGGPWPGVTLMRPDEKARMRRSPACSHEPFALVMTRGDRAPWADHETRTWSLVAFAIAEVSVGRLVSSAMRKRSIRFAFAHETRLPAVATEHHLARDARRRSARGSHRHRLRLDLGPLLRALGRGGAAELRGVLDPGGVRRGDPARADRPHGVRRHLPAPCRD